MADRLRHPTYLPRRPEDGGTGVDAVLINPDDPADVLGVRVGGNPLPEAGWPVDAGWPGRLVVGWSGSMGEGLFEPHPHTWLAAGHAALERCCAAVTPTLQAAGRRLVLQPHHQHVLSDAPLCRAFLDGRGGDDIGVALAPASMLAPSMLADGPDHLARMFEMLGDRCAVVDLADPDDVLPADLLAELLARHVLPGTPCLAAARIGP